MRRLSADRSPLTLRLRRRAQGGLPLAAHGWPGRRLDAERPDGCDWEVAHQAVGRVLTLPERRMPVMAAATALRAVTGA